MHNKHQEGRVSLVRSHTDTLELCLPVAEQHAVSCDG
jgi:hypothetical protein